MSLNDVKFAAITDAGFTSGTLADREYAWLADQTAVASGATLNDQWMILLDSLGYTTGSVNDRQIAAWAALGYGYDNLLLETGDNLLLEDSGQLFLENAATAWNDLALRFWADGGFFSGGAVANNVVDGADNVVDGADNVVDTF